MGGCLGFRSGTSVRRPNLYLWGYADHRHVRLDRRCYSLASTTKVAQIVKVNSIFVKEIYYMRQTPDVIWYKEEYMRVLLLNPR